MQDSYTSTGFTSSTTQTMPRSPDSRQPVVRSDVLKGTLDMLILKTLSVQPMHGYAITQHIERLSQGSLTVEQGSLYPALVRLQAKGWARSKWGETSTKRHARFYTITAAGRKQLGAELSSFDQVLLAINRVLRRA